MTRMRGYLPDLYAEANNGTHQKAADLTGAPAFVWHQAFWNPPVNDREAKGRKDRAKCLEAYLNKLYDNISKNDELLTPTRDEIEIFHDDRVRVITFKFKWRGVLCRIRFEVHTEYFSITSILDASVDLSDGTESGIRSFRRAKKHDLLRQIQSNLTNFNSEIKKIRENHLIEASSSLKLSHSFLYTDIWEEKDVGFFDSILNVDNAYFEDSGENRPNIGYRFADFRGFITCEIYPSAENVFSARVDDLDRLGIEGLQPPFYKNRNIEEVRGRWHRLKTLPEEWSIKHLAGVWPFLNLATSSDDDLPGRTEFTVSSLLNGRAIYASALAPQPTLKRGKGQEKPLFFYIHSATQCERQIGRIVQQLCQLGTLRLAAILPVPALKGVGHRLTSIEHDIAAARARLHKFVRDAGNANMSDPTKSTEFGEILGILENIQNTMSTISEGNFDSGEDEKTQEYVKLLGNQSIEYRLVRSRYYRENFFNGLEALRIARIEGYQPYGDFVRRRLQSAFAFIDSIERRLSDSQNEWRSVDQIFLSTIITKMTAEIDKAQKSITNAHAKANEIQDEIKQIQKWGELALLTFLIPYYFNNLILESIVCDKESSDNWCQSLLVFGSYSAPHQRIIVILTWMVFAALGIFRFSRKRKRPKK